MTDLTGPGRRSLTISLEDGIATLTLDSPNAGNAISLALAREFRNAVDWLAATDARVLVIASTGRLFCAGGDVGEMADASDRLTFLAELAGTMHAALLRMRELPVPIVAAIQGPAAGAGIALVLAADLAVASTSAKFSSAYIKIGLSPDCGVTNLLPAALGTRRAAMFALTDVSLNAEQALEWGLITHVCAPEDLATTVRSITVDLAARPGRSAGETARLVRQLNRPLAQQLDDEARTISALGANPEAAEFIERFASRPPLESKGTS